MNYLAFAHQGDYWELGHKVTFDPVNELVIVAPGVTTLDVQIDLYSDWKEWFKLRDNSGDGEFAIRTVGGDPTVSGQFAGDLYFMINGWRVVYDPTKVQVTGVLFSDDYDTPWLSSSTMEPVYPATVSSLVTKVAPSLEGLDIPTAAEISAQILIDLFGDGRTLTVGKFLGLKD